MEAHELDINADRVTVGAGGRIVIPAAMRRELGVQVCDELVLRVRDGVLHAFTPAGGVQRARALMRDIAAPRSGAVDEFLAERRAEAAREAGGE